MEKTKKDVTVDEMEETSNIPELLKYMEEIEDFKRCEDEVRAATLLETYGFSLDHVPGHLLTSKEVYEYTKYFFRCIINFRIDVIFYYFICRFGIHC